ncbi:MAG TPA: hypothetical protein VFS59_14560 [Gemmatimonadaceae bacterium]|nr:hypothetical protein [Gemmatimonadaceae bacterium]
MERGQFAVSVVMTTHGDAAATDTTLTSLCEQSLKGWELVVQTTGSQETEGSHPWILFVDAGDTLHKSMLARIRSTLAANPSLDAVHCGWSLVDDEGGALVKEQCDADGDLFDLLACRPAFPSCACVVRRAAVEAAGGFDGTMGAAADWVLWQRIARRGARFGRVRESLVSRRAQADRGASPADEVEAALRAIALGHGADPVARISKSAPYATGRLARPDTAEVNALCVAAARELATTGDASHLVALLPAGRRVVDPDAAAASIVRGAPLALAQPTTWWATQWDDRRESLDAFLDRLERRIERPGLARAVAARMQRLVLPHLASTLPPAVSGTHLGIVNVAAPIDDIRVDAATESVQLRVQLGEEVLGTIELTPIEGRVSAYAIRAAVAEEWADRVLARYFARHPEASSLPIALWEPDSTLVTSLAGVLDGLAAGLRHDDGRHRGPPRTMVVEAGHPVPPFTFGKRNIVAELRVAGRKAGSTEIVVGPLGVVSARALRTALCEASEPTLTRIVVRDLVLGAPLTGGPPLHERSAAIARSGARRGT